MAVEQASLGRRCLAEFVGTFILIFIGCGVVLTSVMTGAQSGLWQAAIVWGVGVMGATGAVEDVSVDDVSVGGVAAGAVAVDAALPSGAVVAGAVTGC